MKRTVLYRGTLVTLLWFPLCNIRPTENLLFVNVFICISELRVHQSVCERGPRSACRFSHDCVLT